jgi:hypothetical protein
MQKGLRATALSSFGTPAFLRDFPNDPPAQAQLDAQWNMNIKGWIQQAILGNPWNATYASDQTWFYDPSTTVIPPGTSAAQIAWNAFPGRIQYYLTATSGGPYAYSSQDILSLADTGFDTQGKSFPLIPTPQNGNLYPTPNWSPSTLIPYGPYGPRGWLDEYCEWSVTRDANKNIVRVDFVCENPEYWYTLWRVSPERVRELYESILNFDVPAARRITVTLDDLYLHDRIGRVVIDPSTNEPAYNPLNRWNNGPRSIRTGSPRAFTGGAIHLTSTPNTLQTELGLCGAATVQRTVGNNDPQALICCAQYGQSFRNSDPHIGQSINQFVGEIPARFCLANPLGLYIQLPDTSSWSFAPGTKVPPGALAGDVFQIVRGYASLTDPITGELFPSTGASPGAFILHAVAQIPSAWLTYNPTLTLADISISTNVPSIIWGGQIAQQFNVGLYGRPLAQRASPPVNPCVGSPDDPTSQPLQLFYRGLWDAYYAAVEQSPVQGNPPPLSLVSNTTVTAVELAAGTKNEFALTYAPASSGLPTVEFSTLDGSGVDSTVTATVSAASPVTYAVPGSSYPSRNAVLYLTIYATPNAEPGMRGVRISDAGSSPLAPFLPALLEIV